MNCPYCEQLMPPKRTAHCGSSGCEKKHKSRKQIEFYARYKAEHGHDYKDRYKVSFTCSECGEEFKRNKHRLNTDLCSTCSTRKQRQQAGKASGARRTEQVRMRRLPVHVTKPKMYFKKLHLDRSDIEPGIGRARFVSSRCPVCGEYFVIEWQLEAKYCSITCLRRNSKAKRRTRLKNAYREPVSWERLHREDGPTCYLCGQDTDPEDFSEVMGSDGRMATIVGPTYPTLDHYVALANGGLHDRTNARLACHLCNSIKNDSIVDAA